MQSSLMRCSIISPTLSKTWNLSNRRTFGTVCASAEHASTLTRGTQRSPLFTLEASVGAANPIDIHLLSTGLFHAEVHPDLPIATTWQGLYKQLTSNLRAKARKQYREAAAAAQAVHNAAIVSEIALAEQNITTAGAPPVLHVATVGAQLNSMADITGTMCAAAGVTPQGQPRIQSEHNPHADALLLVSGSHPFRQLPVLRQMLPGSVRMLQQAVKLKQQGVLPQQLTLWAVANPLVEPNASYTEQKIAAGAEVILTQPPLDWDAFASWMEDARRRGLHQAARLLVGFPLLSSSGNVAFWGALCQAAGNEQVKRLQQQFAAAEQQQQQQQLAGGVVADGSSSSSRSQRPQLTQFAEQWNHELLSRLQATCGVSGLHVMPITASSKRLALQMAERGAFSAASWPLAHDTGGADASRKL